MKAILYSTIPSLAFLSVLIAAPVCAQDNPCDNPVSRIEHTACLEYRVEQAEQALERILPLALEAINQRDDRSEEERAAWKAALLRNQEDWLRYRQSECVDLVHLITGLGKTLKVLVRVPVIGVTLRAMRAPAHAAGFGALQEFLETGFRTFRQIPDIDHFLEELEGRAIGIFERIYSTPLNQLR